MTSDQPTGIQPPDQPPPPLADVTRQSDPERRAALLHVRDTFDPPLPDAFADWLVDLLRLARDGAPDEQEVPVPAAIRQLGYTLHPSRTTDDGQVVMTLGAALRCLHPDDPPLIDRTGMGAVELAAALVALGIRTRTTLHRRGGCTVELTDAQAAALAARLLPEEDTATALLDALVDNRLEPCRHDHHGYCQEHGPSTTERCFTADAYAFLASQGLREEPA